MRKTAITSVGILSLVSSLSAHPSFEHTNELPYIRRHAQRAGVDPALLMAIRYAEGNSNYGIKPLGKTKKKYRSDQGYIDARGVFKMYENKTEKNIAWAAHTVRNHLQQTPQGQNSLNYLASKYSPLKASDDPRGLNKNWYRNVIHYYSRFTK